MANLPLGALVDVPELDGRWSVWSPSDDRPGAVFVVPANDEARATGIKFAVITALKKASEAHLQITLLRTDPPLEVLAR